MTGIEPTPADDLLRVSVKAERRLIEREAAAERLMTRAAERVALAEQKLAKALARTERRRAELKNAQAVLRRRQEDRARGPESDAATRRPEVGEVAGTAPHTVSNGPKKSRTRRTRKSTEASQGDT